MGPIDGMMSLLGSVQVRRRWREVLDEECRVRGPGNSDETRCVVADSRTPDAEPLRDQPVVPQRDGGQTRATERPMMLDVRTAPKSRESSELARLSPIAKNVPGRTFTGPK
jgi:hypothetical protein